MGMLWTPTTMSTHPTCRTWWCVLLDGTDSRAWRVWDVVLEQFRAMGATHTEVKADAWRLQHDADYHHSWAVKLPMWSTGLVTYVPRF